MGYIMRALSILLTLLVLTPITAVGYETGDEEWRDNEVDMRLWDDAAELEGSPMDEPRPGDAVLMISVEYTPNILHQVLEVKSTLNCSKNGLQIRLLT